MKKTGIIILSSLVALLASALSSTHASASPVACVPAIQNVTISPQQTLPEKPVSYSYEYIFGGCFGLTTPCYIDEDPPDSFESVWYYSVPIARYSLQIWWQQGDNQVLLDTRTGPAEMEYGDIFPRVATSGSFEVPEEVDLGPASVTFRLEVDVDYYCRDILENSHTWNNEQVYDFQVASSRQGNVGTGPGAPNTGTVSNPIATAGSSVITRTAAPSSAPPPAVLPSTGSPLLLVLAGGAIVFTAGIIGVANSCKRRTN